MLLQTYDSFVCLLNYIEYDYGGEFIMKHNPLNNNKGTVVILLAFMITALLGIAAIVLEIIGGTNELKSLPSSSPKLIK